MIHIGIDTGTHTGFAVWGGTTYSKTEPKNFLK